MTVGQREARFVISAEAPNNDVYGPERRYGMRDTVADEWAMLPSGTLCWGLTHDDALDALMELRGGKRATEIRGEGPS